MSGKRSRDKGATFERLVSDMFKPYYPTAKRGLGQARAGGEVPDVMGVPWWVECKHRKVRVDIQGAYDQALKAAAGRKPPVVVSRKNNSPILVTMDWAMFEQLVLRKWSEEPLPIWFEPPGEHHVRSLDA